MSKLSLVVVWAGMVALAVAGDFPDDRELLAQTAASGPPTKPGGVGVSEDNLAALEHEARVEATLALARLELVLSRKALREGGHEEAARKAHRVLALLEQLPPDMDVSPYELQAEGIVARAARAGVDVEALRRAAAEAGVGRLPPLGADSRLGAGVPEDQRVRYQGALEKAYRDSEARALVEAHESRVIPEGLITYPSDWPEITKRRARYAGGLVARGPSWWDDEGREWYVAVYDIHDLILKPAEFTAPVGHPALAAQAACDREALRQHSYIFRGSAEDLAAGLPLLRYFGGVYDTQGGPRFDLAEQERIIQLIKALTEKPEGGAKVAPLAP